ncbi:MAG: hypothetical protein DWQ36_20200 [Acidobacteria bacterium]|nr:MAG: hypothetical protein DWQ36_20200 [Acidobacteriota bacterium]
MSGAAVNEARRQQLRRRVLADLGGSAAAIDEVLKRSPLPPPLDPGDLPPGDEPQCEAWSDYVREAERDGAVATLRRRLVQLRFPVREGISCTDEYRAATLRGEWPASTEDGVAFHDPDGITIELHRSVAGRVPVLTARDRRDFELLVQALAQRGEPRPVRPEMGAMILRGLNNWDRIERWKQRWLSGRQASDFDGSAWRAEFQRLRQHKDQYQDRLVVLSCGPYSGVAAAELGRAPEQWERDSMIVRREHECAHYLTLRMTGALHSHLHDELVADFAGLVAAYDDYSATLARRLLGIEDGRREGGRVHQYRGEPPLGDEAFGLLVDLTARASESVQEWWRRSRDEARGRASHGEETAAGQLTAAVCALQSLSLEELSRL